jgi:transcriptional regulator with XRE-family HTH domain
MSDRSSGPNPVDVQVGYNVRVKRTELGLSESDIASELGLTVDEYLEYESGTRRLGAERLLKLSKLMNVRPEYFFEGLPPSGSSRGFYN